MRRCLESEARVGAKRLLKTALDWAVEKRLGLILRKSSGVMYAGMSDPAVACSGGAVKLTYLARRFPESGTHGDVLYLVSSALPRGALGWARAAKAKGIRVVVNQNGVAFPAWAEADRLEETNGRFRALLELADHVVYQSEFCRRSCEKWVRARVARSSVVYNPVDTEQFRAEVGERRFDLLLAGSSTQRERVRRPLEALALAKEKGLFWRMRIAGPIHFPEVELRSWISELGIADRVQVSGAYSQAEAPEIYGSARVLIHLQDKDASPTVPLEAMACGLPVVGIASGGMPELVPSSLGALLPVPESWDRFEYPSVKAVFEAVREVLARADAGPALRTHVGSKFSLSAFVRKHEEIFGHP